MSTTLEPADLTGAMVGTTGTIDLTQVTGPGGISYALGGQATLRLHNESNCGLRCFFDNSGQSFNLPAGGWSDCFPKSSDNALNFTVLYTLSSPGVTLLLSTYYYPGEPVPAQTTLGNSPIGGGNVSTNFSELINTGNNPGTSIINVQPNDAASPTWSADNSGNLIIKGDNAGTLTTLLQLIAGASPEIILAASGILALIAGNVQVQGNSRFIGNVGIAAAGGTSGLSLFIDPLNIGDVPLLIRGKSGQTANLLDIENSTPAILFSISPAGNMAVVGSSSLDNGAIATDGAGNFAVKSLTLGGNVAVGSQGSAASLSSNQGIATNHGMITAINLGNITGMILDAPTAADGAMFFLVNNGSGSITFAASGSNVAGGSSVSIAAGNTALFVHSVVDSLWHRIVIS